MMKRLGNLTIATATIALLMGMGSFGQDTGTPAKTPNGSSARTCPYLLKAPDCGAEITRIVFMDQVKGNTYTTTELTGEKRDKYRYAVVSLKISKPAGRRLALAAADLTLHYYHGDQTEVSPCEGISAFAANPDADPPIEMNKYPGPGFLKQTTGAACTQASCVYLDAVFTHLEQDTRECWICVAQPASSQPYTCPSPAWTND